MVNKKVVYNFKPDSIVSIKEYEYDSDGKLVLVKQDKPQKVSTWAKSLVEEIKQDPQCVGKEK
tara:strand:+ start:5800 stop:5988 length:189 start_codon:yes stop_codon:yes gene_type:complete